MLSSENLQEEQWRQVKELIWKEASNIRAVVMVCFCAAAFCLKKVSGFRKKKSRRIDADVGTRSSCIGILGKVRKKDKGCFKCTLC